MGLTRTGWRAYHGAPSAMCPMPKSTKSTFVPKSMQATYEVITTLTDAFCREHLNEDYRMLVQRMTAAKVSIGVEKGPPIGMEKGPLLIIGSGSSPESIGGTRA